MMTCPTNDKNDGLKVLEHAAAAVVLAAFTLVVASLAVLGCELSEKVRGSLVAEPKGPCAHIVWTDDSSVLRIRSYVEPEECKELSLSVRALAGEEGMPPHGREKLQWFAAQLTTRSAEAESLRERHRRQLTRTDLRSNKVENDLSQVILTPRKYGGFGAVVICEIWEHIVDGRTAFFYETADKLKAGQPVPFEVAKRHRIAASWRSKMEQLMKGGVAAEFVTLPNGFLAVAPVVSIVDETSERALKVSPAEGVEGADWDERAGDVPGNDDARAASLSSRIVDMDEICVLPPAAATKQEEQLGPAPLPPEK